MVKVLLVYTFRVDTQISFKNGATLRCTQCFTGYCCCCLMMWVFIFAYFFFKMLQCWSLVTDDASHHLLSDGIESSGVGEEQGGAGGASGDVLEGVEVLVEE